MRVRALTFSAIALGAALVGAAAAAEDKPAKRAKTVDRNRACAAQGEGFIYSPESGACIRIGGSVSTDFSKGTPTWGPGK